MASRFDALVRELRSVKRAHEALTDRITELAEKVQEAMDDAEKPEGEEKPEAKPKPKGGILD